MVTKVFKLGRLATLAAAVVFLTAEFAPAAPPLGHPPLPHHAGPPMVHPFQPVGPHAAQLYGGFGGFAAFGGYRAYSPYYGYQYNAYSYYPYSGGYSGYSPYYGYSSYPSVSYYGSALSTPATPAPTAEEKAMGAVLTASGVPTEEGRPAWPLALRVLPGNEAQALRGQIESLLQVAATQSARGQTSTAVVDELSQATDHLRQLLLRHREERGGMAQHTYEEGERFLSKLAGAQKLLRNS